MEYCGHCGSEQDSGATFCGECGKSVGEIQNTGSLERKTVRRIGIWSATKVSTVTYAVLMIPICFLIGLVMLVSGSGAEAFGIMIGLPIFYITAALIFTAIGTWVFNIVLGWTGGIEVDVS
jgi:hypothetical protein